MQHPAPQRSAYASSAFAPCAWAFGGGHHSHRARGWGGNSRGLRSPTLLQLRQGHVVQYGRPGMCTTRGGRRRERDPGECLAPSPDARESCAEWGGKAGPARANLPQGSCRRPRGISCLFPDTWRHSACGRSWAHDTGGTSTCSAWPRGRTARRLA